MQYFVSFIQQTFILCHPLRAWIIILKEFTTIAASLNIAK